MVPKRREHVIAIGMPTGSGGPWRSRRIANIIRNEICIGVYTYNMRNRAALRGVSSQ